MKVSNFYLGAEKDKKIIDLHIVFIVLRAARNGHFSQLGEQK